jgi:2-oxoglutarate dehydrogenase E1 component
MTKSTQARRIHESAATGDDRVFDLFRRWGYLEAKLDSLGFLAPAPQEGLTLAGDAASRARAVYCGTIGAQFMHIADAKRRQWIIERMEAPLAIPDRKRILERLIRAELFEEILQARYPGTKRYSLEGTAALIPLLDHILDAAAAGDTREVILSMAHRGRLNAMVHIAGREAAEIFASFEDLDPESVLGGGDVKYHVGATGTYHAAGGRELTVRLVSNPSHLEAVGPVAMGRARAKQARLGDQARGRLLPIAVHGEAAFSGQGIVAEALNLADLLAYTVGGAIHIIANNLLGFTTPPSEQHSSRFAADLARRQSIPILHVNGEDLDAVTRVARIAFDYRREFSSDVVVDLIGFRRHGHSEVDDPTLTQPRLYAKIKEHPPLWQIYARAIGEDATGVAAPIRREFEEALRDAGKLEEPPILSELPEYWSGYEWGCYDPKYEVDTGVETSKLEELTTKLTHYPDNFSIHPKAKRLLEQRSEMGGGKRPVDFGMAEALAFGTLLLAGVPVRLAGQDTRRGTFSQRHAALVDTQTESEYAALENLGDGQARCEIVNSPLSEAAALAFEYGYSRDYPEALVLWEAQFGDFVNGAQVIIDQFIAAAQDKWDLPSGIALLLPHGYEGQGPEHSSARLERFLQLAAEDNIQICQPSNAAQYFHLLRRQALRRWRKPLVVLTPKSMLRHPDAVSPLEQFAQPRFLQVVPDLAIQDARRILLCSGKIGHELRRERAGRDDSATAILFLDQLYPFPADELSAQLARHPQAREIVWVQEEPANMGALFYVLPQIKRLANGRPVRSVKRSASASPATGSHKAHELEQKTLLALAFATAEKTDEDGSPLDSSN